MAKTRKASDVKTIEGLPTSKAIWSLSVVHPLFVKGNDEENILNGSAYADTTSSHDKGQAKKVTQFSYNEDMSDVIDDGYTKDRKKVSTLKYNGMTLRFRSDDLTDEQSIFVDELRGYENLCKADDLLDKIEKLVTVSLNAANVRVDIDDLDKLYGLATSRIEQAFVFTSNKLRDIKPESGGKPIKLRKFGV